MSLLVAVALMTVAASTSASLAQPASRWNPPTTPRAFLSEARHGALVQLVATYRLVGSKSAPWTFTYATLPVKAGPPPSGFYKYEATADGQEYEFISNRSGDFECLTRTAAVHWSCDGPIPGAFFGNGVIATVTSYDVEWDYIHFLNPPSQGSTLRMRTVDGLKMSCLSYRPEGPPTWTWCITQRGVLGFVTGPGFLRRIELVSLSFGVPRDEFSLPAKPTKWHGFEDRRNGAFSPPGFLE